MRRTLALPLRDLPSAAAETHFRFQIPSRSRRAARAEQVLARPRITADLQATPAEHSSLRRPLQGFFIQPRPVAQHTVSILNC